MFSQHTNEQVPNATELVLLRYDSCDRHGRSVTRRAHSNAGACLPDHMTSRSCMLAIQDMLRRVLSAVRVAVVMVSYVTMSSAFAQ